MAKDKSRRETELERENAGRNLEPLTTAGQPPEPFTEQEVKTFGEKLQAWGESLPQREQGLLAAFLMDASRSEEEVSGYNMTDSLKLMGEILSNVSKTRSEISMTFARNARA